MRVFYTDVFVLPLPDGHRFPMAKYARLRERVAAAEWLPPGAMGVPDAATDAALLAVHDADYVRRVIAGELERAEVRRIGFPWSPGLVVRSRRSVGGTIAACRAALEVGVGVNLAGGTHHAGPDWGEGFCVFNDCVVALKLLQAEGRIGRAAVVDTDVHQGNGTAALAREDPSLFAFSIHGAKNFPLRKVAGDLDIGLPDGATDGPYLQALAEGLEAALAFGPELVVFLSGADPFEGDALGRLDLTKAGLRERDRMVLAACRARELPVAIVMGGGYAPAVEDIVDIHFATVETARELYGP